MTYFWILYTCFWLGICLILSSHVVMFILDIFGGNGGCENLNNFFADVSQKSQNKQCIICDRSHNFMSGSNDIAFNFFCNFVSFFHNSYAIANSFLVLHGGFEGCAVFTNFL